jgi:hypothetical protein
LGHLCTFSAHGLLRLMDLHTGGDEHRRLHEAIIRLTACAVEITHEGNTYFGPLIKSGAKREATSYYAIGHCHIRVSATEQRLARAHSQVYASNVIRTNSS